MKNQPKTTVILILRNKNGKIEECSSQSNSDKLQQEQLRQSRTKFNLACTLAAVSAAFGFTGVGLFWSGHLPENKVLDTINLLAGIAKVSWRLLEGKEDVSDAE